MAGKKTPQPTKGTKVTGKTDLAAGALDGLEPFEAEAWLRSPLLIKRFLEQRPAYDQLCSEVAYTIRTIVQKHDIHVAAVTQRAKELTSFLEKVNRKGSKDPFNDITDFGGARVVCYYADDLAKVATLIEESFDVVERDDKTEASGVDRFGYGGIHYLVRLGKNASGPRYDALKDKICELQLRTVMQDAWAIVSHHLLYKREQDMPPTLRRGVNALSGALDSADLAFQAIRNDRDNYVRSVSHSIEEQGLQTVEVNLDSLKQYLEEKYPNLPYDEKTRDTTSDLLNLLIKADIKNLGQVEDLLTRTSKARNYFMDHHPQGKSVIRSAASEVKISLYLMYPKHRPETIVSDYLPLYEEASKLVD